MKKEMVRTKQNRTGQARPGQDRTGQDRTGQDRTGQDRTGQDRTGQDRTGQDRTDVSTLVSVHLRTNIESSCSPQLYAICLSLSNFISQVMKVSVCKYGKYVCTFYHSAPYHDVRARV
jgi:hypothetical protein